MVTTLSTIAQNINQNLEYSKLNFGLFPKATCRSETNEMLKGKIIFTYAMIANRLNTTCKLMKIERKHLLQGIYMH